MKITVKDFDQDNKKIEVFFDKSELEFFDKAYMIFDKIKKEIGGYYEKPNYDELVTRVKDKQIRSVYFHSLFKAVTGLNFYYDSIIVASCDFITIRESTHNEMQVFYSFYKMLYFIKRKTLIEYIIPNVHVNVFVKYVKEKSITWIEAYKMLVYFTTEDVIKNMINYAAISTITLYSFSNYLFNWMRHFLLTVDANSLNYSELPSFQNTHGEGYKYLFYVDSILRDVKVTTKLKGYKGEGERIKIEV